LKKIFSVDPWKVTEMDMHPQDNRLAESVMSIGNGHMGMRGNFEEDYSGDSLQGTYIGGVYYPDKTRVGWWKIGYPEYYAKVLNAPNFIGIRTAVDGVNVDLAQWDVENFERSLDMRRSCLQRSFTLVDNSGRRIDVAVTRFLSRSRREVGAIRYAFTPKDHRADILFTPYLDGDVYNEDANYGEQFWSHVSQSADSSTSCLTMETKKTAFVVSTAMRWSLDGADPDRTDAGEKQSYVENQVQCRAEPGQTVTLTKYAAVTTSRDWPSTETEAMAVQRVNEAYEAGWDSLFDEHCRAWKQIWTEGDVVIEGDDEAQQGVRFNILQLQHTYTGEDPRLNIGPKGFTGEKYGGSTYWDTEAYCLPFYMSTMDHSIARNLLLYRYNHLEKAIENASKLGCEGALYPMVTMNGEECHNEWEITFEEIHRNAAISYAIFNYVRYTKDKQYLADYGYEVLLETSRYWADRVSYQPRKDVYMILGVTGPNEYENNINNNWHTNTMAAWNLEYALEVRSYLRQHHPERLREIEAKRNLHEQEPEQWQDIRDKMYKPFIEEHGVFAQQDLFMDKEQLTVDQLDPDDLPLNQNWSWDRILRSVFIKQADVLQGLFFLNDRFDQQTKQRNFDFYEPRTVHESSLSPCVYSIIAGEIGRTDKAYELYLRTARLDLDNYNNDTEDGLHITSMAGSWMSIVYGFGGLRVCDDQLHLNPFKPAAWERYAFKLVFRGHLLRVEIAEGKAKVTQEGGKPVEIVFLGKTVSVPADETLEVDLH